MSKRADQGSGESTALVRYDSMFSLFQRATVAVRPLFMQTVFVRSSQLYDYSDASQSWYHQTRPIEYHRRHKCCGNVLCTRCQGYGWYTSVF